MSQIFNSLLLLFGLGLFPLSLFFQKFDKIRDFSLSVEINWLLFLSPSEEFDGGEPFDTDSVNFVQGGVDLRDEDVFVGFELGGQFLVFGGQGLAVTAPGSVELHQHVLAFIVHH